MNESNDSRSGSNHLPACTSSAYLRANESLTCIVSRSSVKDSSSRAAAKRMVPPGVS